MVEPTPVDLETRLGEQNLLRAGRVNPGDSPQIPIDLYTHFQPYFGDKLWLKAGGYLEMNTMVDGGARGSSFSFSPSQLGVEGAATRDTHGFLPLGEDARISYRRTRLYLDAYSPLPDKLHGTRAYGEVDFSGKNGHINIRHLYISLPYVLIGRTTSAFTDPSAEPESLDPGGPNGTFGLRQEGLRLVIPLGEDNFSLGWENPGPSISPSGFDLNDDNLKRKQDVAAHYRSKTDWGHLQFSAIRRDLSLQDDVQSNAINRFTGWGLGLSGQVFTEEKDNFQFEISGGPGLGRYVNDLAGSKSEIGTNSAGQEGVQLAWGGFVAYQHWLDEETRLNAYLSMAQVNLLDGQPADSFQRGYMVSLNLVRDLTDSVRLGLEYDHGLRVSRDGATAGGGRFLFQVRYGF